MFFSFTTQISPDERRNAGQGAETRPTNSPIVAWRGKSSTNFERCLSRWLRLCQIQLEPELAPCLRILHCAVLFCFTVLFAAVVCRFCRHTTFLRPARSTVRTLRCRQRCSATMERQSQHKTTGQSLWRVPLCVRSELNPHPLAEQAQACGRLTEAEGPEGPVAPIVTTLTRHHCTGGHADLLCIVQRKKNP